MHLNCHTYYSFKYGTLSVENLVAEAKKHKLDALALTDINSTSAVFPFIREAQRNGIHPVVGIDFRNGIQPQYIGLAKNQDGFYALNRHLTEHLMKQRPFEDRAPEMSDTFIIYPLTEAVFALRDNEYIGVHPAQLNRLPYTPWARYKDRLVLLQPVSFLSRTAFNAHRLLRSMDQNTLLSKLPLSEQGDPSASFYSYADMVARCQGHSYLIYNAQKLLELCQFSFYFQAVKNRRDVRGSDWEDFDYLRRETFEGALRRYGSLDEVKEKRILKELEIVHFNWIRPIFQVKENLIHFVYMNPS